MQTVLLEIVADSEHVTLRLASVIALEYTWAYTVKLVCKYIALFVIEILR